MKKETRTKAIAWAMVIIMVLVCLVAGVSALV